MIRKLLLLSVSCWRIRRLTSYAVSEKHVDGRETPVARIYTRGMGSYLPFVIV
jgi:hypothetical protein